jgi:hypothetical protein
MSWLKSEEPAKAPAAPRHIDVAALYRHVADVERLGPLPPQLRTLKAAAPPLAIDRWGMPLPLTAPQQARLDRIGAILADPWSRPKALLRAGQLGPDEVQALADGRPDELAQLAATVEREMVLAGPPLPQWVESQLAILFQKPSNLILTGGPDEADAGKGKSKSPARGGEGPHGTPSDRRELAVRIG